MSHLSYYHYQTNARGVSSIDDIKRIAENHRHFYDLLVLPWLPADKECRIAELACGHGSLLYWLSTCGYRNVVGIDISESQTTLARKVCDEIITSDAINWLVEQPDSSLDVIFGIDFAEHISKDDFMKVLEHAGRTLTRGGKIILRLPNGASPFVGVNLFNDITHVWTYTPNCLATLGRMHGLETALFNDESTASIRDHRWIKVPLSRLVRFVLASLLLCAAKVRIRWWNPHLWACLGKA